MAKEPHTIPDLIAAWDSIAEFSNSVGCGYEAARKMRTRKKIAPEHWMSVVKAAEAKGIKGITIEWLASQRTMEAAE